MSMMTLDPQPYFSAVYIPTLPSLHLSDAEQQLISTLQMRQWRQRGLMELTDAYYRGMQIITNLRIAIPPELEFLRTIVGWPGIAVDPLVEKMSIDGFRFEGSTVSDPDLEEVWLLNGMDAEQSMAFTDAFSMGRTWFTAGSPVEKGDPPVVCVESPLNMSASWDSRSAKPKELLQSYWLDDRRHAALYLPDQTIQLAQNDDYEWEIVDRDKHNLGLIPAVRMANRPRTNQRDGGSEITAHVMSITDAACRTLLGAEVAREFYSVPQKVILGATEEDFQNPDGTKKTAWQTYISSVLALEPHEDGSIPTLHQFASGDPSTFTKLIEMYACQMAGILGANPQDLGLYTQGNPVSAAAQDVVDSRRDRKVRFKQRLFNRGPVEIMQIAGMLMNKGVMPAEYKRMTVDWMDPSDLNIAVMTDAMAKQSAMGSISASSDLTLKKLGWSAVERAQHAKDRAADPTTSTLDELAASVAGKVGVADTRIAKDLAPDVAPVPPAA